MRGPIGNNFSRPRFPVNLHQGLYLYVLDKLRVDYTQRWTQLGAIGPMGLRPALCLMLVRDSGVTESLFGGGGGKGGPDLHLGVQQDGIKGTQAKVKWGARGAIFEPIACKLEKPNDSATVLPNPVHNE